MNTLEFVGHMLDTATEMREEAIQKVVTACDQHRAAAADELALTQDLYSRVLNLKARITADLGDSKALAEGVRLH